MTPIAVLCYRNSDSMGVGYRVHSRTLDVLKSFHLILICCPAHETDISKTALVTCVLGAPEGCRWAGETKEQHLLARPVTPFSQG